MKIDLFYLLFTLLKLSLNFRIFIVFSNYKYSHYLITLLCMTSIMIWLIYSLFFPTRWPTSLHLYIWFTFLNLMKCLFNLFSNHSNTIHNEIVHLAALRQRGLRGKQHLWKEMGLVLSSVHLVQFDPFNPFSILRSTLVHLVIFGLFSLLRSIQSNSIHFGLFGPFQFIWFT